MNNIKKLEDSILSKYYKVDNNVVIVDLYFNTFSELIDLQLGDDSVEKLNDVFFNKIDEAFSIIPSKYKMKLNVHIKDFEDYNIEQMETIIRDNIGLYLLKVYNQNRRHTKAGIVMTIAGTILLFASYFISKYVPQVLNDIVNISGTLLIWEAVTRIFIDRNNNTSHALKYVNKLIDVDVIKD